jgi:hypothetical protein
LPGEAEPKAAIVIFFFAEIDATDDLVRSGFQAESPMPGFAAFYRGEGHVTNVAVCAVRGIGPRNLCR